MIPEREIYELRANLFAARAEISRLRETWATIEEVSDLRSMLAERDAKIAEQAQVIDAQRVNMDAARQAIENILEMAVDEQGDWVGIETVYAPSRIVPIRKIEQSARAALEGVEADSAEGDEPDTN